MMIAAALFCFHTYKDIFGCDLFFQAIFAQNALSEVHHLERELRQSLLGISELHAFEGDIFRCWSLDGVEDVFLFNGYPLLLFVTLYLCVLSETTKSLRVVLTHTSDLYECGALVHGETKVKKQRTTLMKRVKMGGSGKPYDGFYLELTKQRRERVLNKMTSELFLEEHPDFAQYMRVREATGLRGWKLKEIIKKGTDFVHPEDPDKTGSLELMRDNVQKWVNQTRGEAKELGLQRKGEPRHLYEPNSTDTTVEVKSKSRKRGGRNEKSKERQQNAMQKQKIAKLETELNKSKKALALSYKMIAKLQAEKATMKAEKDAMSTELEQFRKNKK